MLAVTVVVCEGCWGRKFFRMPRETIDTSTKVDSLLKENARLQRRVYLLEMGLNEQQDYNRTVSAQTKIDLEELMDQMNALQQMLREAMPGVSFGYQPGRRAEVDAAGTAAAQPGPGGGPADEGGPSDVVGEDAAGADVSPGTTGEGTERVGTGTETPADSGAAVPGSGIVVPGPDEFQRQIYLDFSRREFQLALEESDLFLGEYPDHPLGEDIRLIRGECYMEQDKHFDALKEFSILLQQYPNGRKVPAALFRMAVSYERIGEREIAAGVVRRLIREHAYSEEAGAAEERFADLLNE